MTCYISTLLFFPDKSWGRHKTTIVKVLEDYLIKTVQLQKNINSLIKAQ